MHIRAKVDLDLPTHKIPKGKAAQVSEELGRAAVERGEAVELDHETAMKELHGAAPHHAKAKKQSGKAAAETR